MKKAKHIVYRIQEGSIAEELELESGDELLTINGQAIEDVFDYHYLVNDEYIELLVRKKNGEEWLLEVEKDLEEDLGVEFENSLMDEYRSCSNQCMFCFIDQMPPGMRDTLYFKDDDSRLSFLQGNYVTLTNMSDHDIDRIIHYHLSPINISFHTTNPQLRCEMLHNRFAGDIFTKVERLFQAGIEMNGQIVLCRGINDGEELQRSISDLSGFLPHLRSLSVVPVGLSKFREGLYPLHAFEAEDAKKVLETIRNWQVKLYDKYRTHFVHGGDEWYILANEELPDEKTYDGYLQLENGVGMIRLLEEEIKEGLKDKVGDNRRSVLSLATGELASAFMKQYITWIQQIYPGISVHIYPIRNHFFGESITVSGLITGADLEEQLKDKKLGERLLLPCNMLRSGEKVFLDDVTVEQLEQRLQIPIEIVETAGRDLIHSVTCQTKKREHKRRQIYEQTNSGNCRTS